VQLLVPSSPHLVVVIHLPSSLHAMYIFTLHAIISLWYVIFFFYLHCFMILFFLYFFPIHLIFFYFHYLKNIFKITFFDIANQLGPLIHKHDTKYSFVIPVEVHVACALYKLAQGTNLLICNLMNFLLLVDL